MDDADSEPVAHDPAIDENSPDENSSGIWRLFASVLMLTLALLAISFLLVYLAFPAIKGQYTP